MKEKKKSVCKIEKSSSNTQNGDIIIRVEKAIEKGNIPIKILNIYDKSINSEIGENCTQEINYRSISGGIGGNYTQENKFLPNRIYIYRCSGGGLGGNYLEIIDDLSEELEIRRIIGSRPEENYVQEIDGKNIIIVSNTNLSSVDFKEIEKRVIKDLSLTDRIERAKLIKDTEEWEKTKREETDPI